MTKLSTLPLALLLLQGCLTESKPNPPDPASVVVAILSGVARAATADAAKQQHDQLFSDPARRSGLHGSHYAAVALTPPDQAGQPPRLLLVDELGSEAAARQYAGDASVSALFAAAPELTIVAARDGWEGWGADPIGANDARAARYVVVIRGGLRDQATAQNTHNTFFGGGKPNFQAAGYQRHHAYGALGADDQLEMIGVWTSLDNLQAASASPPFAALVSELFASPPAVGVYATGDWVGWSKP